MHPAVFTDPNVIPVGANLRRVGRTRDAIAERCRNRGDAKPHEAVGVDGKLSLTHAIEPELEANGRDR